MNSINKTTALPTFLSSLIGCILMLALPANIFSVEVKKIDINRFEDFQQGEFRGTSLDSKGRLFIGPRIRKIPGPSREYYLSLDVAANGDIYVGTGHTAAVYRITPAVPVSPASGADGSAAGTIEEVFRSDALDVFALAVRKKGGIYAATSPEGKVYKISLAPAGKNKKGTKTGTTDTGMGWGMAADTASTHGTHEEILDPDEKFIWDLKEDNAGNLICAVGSSGGVYRIDPAGQAVKIFTSEDTHIISLYIAKGGAILAGSGDRGILYRIDDRKVKVLFDSPFEEIRGICADKSGNIYFSATKGIARDDGPKNAPVPRHVKKGEKEKEIKILEKSVLYCLSTSGTVEKSWSSRTEYIYSVCYDEKFDSVIIGTGDSGRLYRVKKDGGFSIIYESDSAQAFRIAGDNKGFTLITNNTASIAAIENTLSKKGIYYSGVYDLQIQSRLGRLYWEAQTPPQTEVQLCTRTGNSNVPDKTWTQWSPPFTDSENSTVNVTGCRYFQVKAVLSSGNPLETPYLDRFNVFYIQSNIGPQLKGIEIKKPAPKPLLIADKTKEDQKKTMDSNRLIVRWRAVDRNADKLKYNIYIKKYDAGHWILIREDITEKELKLDTAIYQDGKYLLRVVVDDSPSNPPAMAKSHELQSAPFLIDATAPVIGNFTATGTRIHFDVMDRTSLIAGVLYSFEGKSWYPVFPVDMINDSRAETYDVDLKKPRSKKFIFIKALDEFGNCSVFQEEL